MKKIKIMMVEDNSFARMQYWSKQIAFAFIVFLLTVFGAQPLGAQRIPFPRQMEGLKRQTHEACWKSSDLVLTAEQTRTLGLLQRNYTGDAAPLRRELMSLRFELFHFIQDSNIQSNILFDRQKKISELRTKLDNLSLSYQIKA